MQKETYNFLVNIRLNNISSKTTLSQRDKDDLLELREIFTSLENKELINKIDSYLKKPLSKTNYLK